MSAATTCRCGYRLAATLQSLLSSITTEEIKDRNLHNDLEQLTRKKKAAAAAEPHGLCPGVVAGGGEVCGRSAARRESAARAGSGARASLQFFPMNTEQHELEQPP